MEKVLRGSLQRRKGVVYGIKKMKKGIQQSPTSTNQNPSNPYGAPTKLKTL